MIKFSHVAKQLEHEAEWFWMKVLFSLLWLQQMVFMSMEYQYAPHPVGIHQLIDYSVVFQFPWVGLLYIMLIVTTLFYLSERNMRWTTLAGALLSVLIITHHESNGIFKRTTVYSLIWAAQSIAYWQFTDNQHKRSLARISYSIQVISALYVLSGIAKLQAVGWQWPTLTVGSIPVVIMKGALVEYYTRGNEEILQKAQTYIQLVMSHPSLFYFLMLSVLIAELTALFAVCSPRSRIVYGIYFAGMHIGIWLFLDIVIAAQFYSMMIFFLNPAYHIYRMIKKVWPQSTFNRKDVDV